MNPYYNKTAASVDTFLEQIRQRNTKSNRTTIYRALLKTPNSTKNQLIKATGMPHQTLTSQLSVLMDMGIVEVSGATQSIGSTGTVYESFFKVQKDKDKIAQNQIERRILKFRRLKKQLNEFADIIPTEALEAINSV